ncbi:hypothetical protein [Nocardia paucivorans]|nr:hypothetical protein [Nocardia paucivorans]
MPEPTMRGRVADLVGDGLAELDGGTDDVGCRGLPAQYLIGLSFFPLST